MFLYLCIYLYINEIITFLNSISVSFKQSKFLFSQTNFYKKFMEMYRRLRFYLTFFTIVFGVYENM